jgi:predicted nuclease of predicted toxin-antitoxin system
MKFYLDEDSSQQVAVIARRRCGLDVVSAHEVGTNEAPDDVQLAYAAAEGRCLVTRNRDHFIEATLAAFAAQTPHAGLLIIPRSWPGDRPAAIAAALCDYATRFPEGLSPYTINFL